MQLTSRQAATEVASSHGNVLQVCACDQGQGSAKIAGRALVCTLAHCCKVGWQGAQAAAQARTC
jgi:hypothetical protein